MNFLKTTNTLFFTVVFILCFGSALAGGTGGIPAQNVKSLSQVSLRTFPTVDLIQMQEEDTERELEGLPFRFAFPNQVDISPANSGTWEEMSSGQHIWRQRLSCPDAVSLNLGFESYHLPESASLLIYSATGEGPVFVFDASDNRFSGDLWTPVILSDEMVIELKVASADIGKVKLILSWVNCGYRGFGDLAREKSGACNIDVICSEGDSWREDIPSIAMYSINGFQKCSGVLVNNTAQDERPLFLTANHCNVSEGNISSVVVYWNYESPNCGDHGGGTLDQFSNGETFLAASYTSDFALFELENSPDPALGINYAGWDRSDSVPDAVVGIHHPSTDEKSICFENDPLTITTYLDELVPGNGTHFRVADWDAGTTEGGSSGSPIFDENHRIVGQLHGGYAACGNDLPDWYGRLFTSWEGDGSAETRLKDYLDPTGSDVMFLSRYGVVDPDPDPDPPAHVAISMGALSANPFLTDVDITYQLNRDNEVHARIFNLKGHAVCDFAVFSGVEGENTFNWDGLNTSGQPVPSGVYLIYLEADDETALGKVVRLR
ncbi:MAG: T9SS type A sorting domain-containing protein [bacterium]|nr:T9SS type A sorting domain-containing protein [bacterium]